MECDNQAEVPLSVQAVRAPCDPVDNVRDFRLEPVSRVKKGEAALQGQPVLIMGENMTY